MFAASKSGQAAAAAPTSDPYFPYVPLLLETTSTNGQQNNTFLDSSTNNFTITRNGTPTQGSVTPYWPDGYWSNYIGGASNYFTGPSNAAFTLGTGDFTIEAWVYPTSSSGVQGVLGLADGESSGSCTFFYNLTAGKVTLSSYLGTTATSTASLTLNAWTHVAFSRASGSLKTFINGALDNTIAFADNLTKTAFVVGRSYSTLNQEYFFGYVSNVRVVKGTAVYTSAFTPSTIPLTAISGTSVLTCQSNRFKDNSTNNFTLTVGGTPRTQAFQPFSPTASYTAAAYGGSIYNGIKTDVLTTPSVASLTTFTGDFTLEAWVYPTDTSLVGGWGILDTRTSGSTPAAWVFSLNSYSSGWIVSFYNSSSNVVNFSTRIQAFTWTHVVVQRNGSTLRAFINGVVDATTGTVSGTVTGGSSTVYITNTKDNSIGGYGNIGCTSNLRIVNGTAVYSTSGFTPPTAPVTAIANTSLLTNFTNAGVYDAAAQNNAITVGDAQASTTQYKWSPTSMKFDGTGDWLTAIDNPQLQLGTGDFTIDGWVYLSATGVAYGIISKGAASTGWSVNVTSGNKLQFSYTSSNLTGATSLAATTWYYFAVVRSGSATGNLKVYLNGSVEATSGGAVTDNFNQTSILYVGANRTGGSALNGYLQDVRVTKYARTITTPTAAFQTR
jgi:hypothetical protein